MPKKGDRTPKLNLVGQKFGLLTVTEYAGYNTRPDGRIYHKWKCICDCGNEKIVETRSLRSKHCKSCGCLPHKPINAASTHNMTNTKLYNVWKSMKGRCYTKSCHGYNYYGGRGITVYEKWKNDFMSFYKWSMENGYKPGLTIDRIDVNGNYEPNNCRWVDFYEQNNNKTDTKYYDIDGEHLTLREISKKYNIPYGTLKGRIDNKYPITDAVYGDFSRDKIYLEYNGERHTIPVWSKITGIKKVTLYARYYKGWSAEKILTEPITR